MAKHDYDWKWEAESFASYARSEGFRATIHPIDVKGGFGGGYLRKWRVYTYRK